MAAEFFDLPQRPSGPLTARSTSGSDQDPFPVTGFESAFTVHPIVAATLPTLLGIGAGAAGGPLAGAAVSGLTAGAFKGPTAGVTEGLGFLGGGLLGKGIGAGVAKLGEKKAMQFFAEKAVALTKLVKSKVPAWANLPNGAAGLVKMFQGQDALSAEFDKELTKQIGAGKGKELLLRVDDLAKLGATPLRIIQGAPGPQAPGLPTYATVEASEIIPKIIGRWKKDPGLYRRVVEGLDQIGVGDPKAREAYRWGSGTIQYLNATQALEGEEFRLDRAQAGLLNTKTFDFLRRRGMGEFAQVIRGQAPLPVVPVGRQPFREAGGLLAGATVGGLVGHPFIGAGAGREAVRAAARTAFTNIPQGPVGPLRQAVQLGSPLVGGGLGGLLGASVTPSLAPAEAAEQFGSLREHRKQIERAQQETAPPPRPSPPVPKESNAARVQRLLDQMQTGGTPLSPEEFKFLREQLK